MNQWDIDQLSECLGRQGIKYKISDDVILIDRDSICQWDITDRKTTGDLRKANGEQDHYDALLRFLNTIFKAHFSFVYKNDDWLMLDKIEKKE